MTTMAVEVGARNWADSYRIQKRRNWSPSFLARKWQWNMIMKVSGPWDPGVLIIVLWSSGACSHNCQTFWEQPLEGRLKP